MPFGPVRRDARLTAQGSPLVEYVHDVLHDFFSIEDAMACVMVA